MKQFLLKFSPVYKFIIFGDSMSPILCDGQFVLVNRLSYFLTKPKVGDIVAFRDPRNKKILIKRITDFKNGKYFVSGDNKKHSTDSRNFGMIARREIVGKVF